jgi:CheY-like chemotaxis protein
LLVESNEDCRSMYAAYLHKQNVECMLAATTDDGLARATEADVVVTGIKVVGSFDGVEFVCRLRADKRTRRLPVIVLTACAGKADRERAEQAGCDAFLAKPCLPHDLLREVRRVFAMSAVRDARATLRTPRDARREPRPRRAKPTA